MANITCTVNGCEWSHNGYFGSDYAHGLGYAGYNGSLYYVYVLKFTTPNFSGVLETLDFTIACEQLLSSSTKANLRYAICTSDENGLKYNEQVTKVSNDTTQLISGIAAITGLSSGNTTYHTFSTNATALQPNTTYYLYLWGYSKTVAQGGAAMMQDSSKFTITGTTTTNPSAIVNCGIIGQADDSALTYETNTSSYVGYGSTTTWYRYALKFVTPDFKGTSTELNFTIYMSQGYRNGSKSPSVVLRWALCNSDSNWAMYKGTGSDITEANQLNKGKITFDGLSSTPVDKTLTVQSTVLAPNTTYYLMIWGCTDNGYSGDTATVNIAPQHLVVLSYNAEVSLGVVRIDTGSGWITAVPYIDTGSGWVRATAYIDNGTEWKMCN